MPGLGVVVHESGASLILGLPQKCRHGCGGMSTWEQAELNVGIAQKSGDNGCGRLVHGRWELN